MTIGQLRDRVTIQNATQTTDTQGGRANAWGTYATVWASVTTARGAENLQTSALRSIVPYVVVMRYRGDVTPEMRLSWRPYRAETAKSLQILSVSDLDGRRTWLTLNCAEAA